MRRRAGSVRLVAVPSRCHCWTLSPVQTSGSSRPCGFSFLFRELKLLSLLALELGSPSSQEP